MPSKEIVRMGTLSLQEKSLPITAAEFGSSYLYDLIKDLKDSREEQGGVGIAAPQIGVNKRIVVFGYENHPRYPNEKGVPLTVLINPTIELLTDEMHEAWEGCLSVPGLRGLVPRFTKIKYDGFNEEGEKITCIAENFHARMVQHEVDHLDGILYIERIRDLKNIGYDDIIFERVYGKK